MIKPSVYLYNETSIGFEIYFGECSVSEGLSFFHEDTELVITSFGATLYKKYGYATEKELPVLDSVGSIIAFLETEGDIGIIEFEADLPKVGTISSHDDGECHFVLKSRQQCISVLTAAIQPEYSNMLINRLVENQGLYLTCSEKGKVGKYYSFDEYLAKNS